MSTPTRIAVIGGGSQIFEAAHAPAIAALGLDVVGLFDVAVARANVVGDRFGWPVATDLDALLALAPDVVTICTPHPLHADLILRALDAGADVLVEKPLAGSLSEIDSVVAAADASGRTVAVLQQHRLRSEVEEARRLISGGLLGAVHRADLVASYPKRSNYYTDTSWRGTWAGEGGGVLLNQGLHDVDLLQHLLGRPARVFASERTLVHPIEAEDTADLLIEWPEGHTATVHVTSAAGLEDNRVDVFGSAADLRLTAHGLYVRRHEIAFDEFARTPGGHLDAYPRGDWELSVPHGGGTHQDAYEDLLSALANDRDPSTPARSARQAVEIIAAAAVSSARRAVIELPLGTEAQDELLRMRIKEAAE